MEFIVEIRKGEELYEAGRMKEALDHFKKACESGDDSFDTHMMLGTRFTLVRATREAYEEFTAAVEIDASDPTAHASLGLVCELEEKYLDAKKALSTAIELGQNDEAVYSSLFRCLLQLREYEEAEKVLNDPVLEDDEAEDKWFNLGWLRSKQERYSEAIDCFSQMLQANEDSLTGHICIADALCDAKRPQEALKHLRKATTLEPTIPIDVYNIALIASALGDSEIATQHLRLLEKRDGQLASELSKRIGN